MEIIYAIPGLGTTKDLFEHITVPAHELKVLDWPHPKSGHSLKEYAGLFLSQIDASRPVNLLGVSFGGMICCELAELVTPGKIVLISSCKKSTELPFPIRMLRCFPLQKLLSERLYRRFGGSLSRMVGFEKNYLPKFIAMMQAMPLGYFRRCVNMIIHWDRKSNSHPVHHIHGDADNLLLFKYITGCDTIPKGNHAMVVYKAAEINVCLNRLFNG